MAKSKLVSGIDRISDDVTGGFQRICDGVTGTYQKIEDAVVGGYTKVEDAFVDEFLTRDGETVEAAKRRLARENEERRAAQAVRHSAARK